MRYASLSVLVVDLSRSRKKDDQLMSYLREKGFHHKSVRDTKRAEEAIRKGSVQIVIVLLGSRGAKIESVLRRLHKANTDVPTIVVSAKPSLEESVEVIRGRAFDYITAPCRWEELDDSVQTAIEEKGYQQSMEDRLHEAVGKRLREARVDRDLTLRQLANRTGLSVSLISQIELARSCASVSTLFKLTRALKIKLVDIFAGF